MHYVQCDEVTMPLSGKSVSLLVSHRCFLLSSSSDLGPKERSVESSVTDVPSQHDGAPYVPVSRAVLPSVTNDQPLPLNHSGECDSLLCVGV